MRASATSGPSVGTSFPSAAEIAAALGGRSSGHGWMARCPAHDDRTPSLSITERDGLPLVHCHAGCSQGTVIATLREHGLWRGAPDRHASARRVAEQQEREAAAAARRDRWLAALGDLRDAQADVALLRALLRDDPEESDSRTTALLDALGDVYLREQLSEERLDATEREDRALREGVRCVAG